MKELLKQLPKMNELLAHPDIKAWSDVYHTSFIKDVSNHVLDQTRQAILAGSVESVDQEAIVQAILEQLSDKSTPSLQRVVNATGTVLHTNLGRSVLSEQVMDKIKEVGMSYTNLEYKLAEGHRGSRYSHVEDLLCELTGAEAALVVNNNAAAVMLLLSATVPNKEILVSRGELVEIGGSFRIPDVIESVGATLKEVGATNKTHIADYERAINEETGALVKVHTSNYRLIGFTETPSDKELVDLAHEHNLPAFNDLGSGLMLDLQSIGLPYEPTIAESVSAGYDVVTFSGDKLLGGPQAGILVGKKDYIDVLKKHPLLRALRVDKFTMAALEGVLRSYRQPSRAFAEIPVLSLLNQSEADLLAKAEQLQEAIEQLDLDFEVSLVSAYSQVGGGAFPEALLPTTLVQVSHPSYSESQLERYLRLSKEHIIPRISDGAVQFDVRTLLASDLDRITDVLASINEMK